MNKKIYNEVIVFHDETEFKDLNLKGHVFFFVPAKLTVKEGNTLFGELEYYQDGIGTLSRLISKIRTDYGFPKQSFHFSDISGSRWDDFGIAYLEFFKVIIDSLRNRSQIPGRPFNCKLAIILYPSTAAFNFYTGNNKKEKLLKYDETLMRMLLKGAIHYLYDETNEVYIQDLVTDGMPYHRQISEDRILGRIIYDDIIGNSPLKNYAVISNTAGIQSQSSHHSRFEPESLEYQYANMLQIADNLVGAAIRVCFFPPLKKIVIPKKGDLIECDRKSLIAYPVMEMLYKVKRGYGFKFSSHHRAFTITKAYIENGKWKFDNITNLLSEERPDEKIGLLFQVTQ